MCSYSVALELELRARDLEAKTDRKVQPVVLHGDVLRAENLAEITVQYLSGY